MRLLSLAGLLVACAGAAPATISPAPPPRPPEPASPVAIARDSRCRFAFSEPDQQNIENVSFAYNSAELATNEVTCCALLGVADFLLANVEVTRVAIEVHSDERGNYAYNLAFTQKRAEAIAHALLRFGVQASRLVPVGFGESCPLNTAYTPIAWATNSRIVLTILRRTGAPPRLALSCNTQPPVTPLVHAAPKLSCPHAT